MNYILLKPLPTLNINELIDEKHPLVQFILQTNDEKIIQNWIKPEPTEEELLEEQLQFEQRELEFAFSEKIRLEQELNNINSTIFSVEKTVTDLTTEKNKLIEIKSEELDVKK